jgi:hypothetical protein
MPSMSASANTIERINRIIFERDSRCFERDSKCLLLL